MNDETADSPTKESAAHEDQNGRPRKLMKQLTSDSRRVDVPDVEPKWNIRQSAKWQEVQERLEPVGSQGEWYDQP